MKQSLVSFCLAPVLVAVIAVVVLHSFPPKEYQEYLLKMQQGISQKSQIAEIPACGGGSIEYALEGPENGQPVLVVHGAMGGFDQGLLFGNSFVERGYRVVAPSRFGYLRSPLPGDQVSTAMQAKAFACLLDALRIDQPVIVYGVSAGSPSSLRFAHDYPDRTRALILQVPAVSSITDPQTNKPYFRMPPGTTWVAPLLFLPFDAWHWVLSKLAPGVLIGTVGGTPPDLYHNQDKAERDRIDAFIASFFPVAPRLEGLMKENEFKAESVDYIVGIAAPTMTVGFQDDRYRTYEIARTIANGIPHAHFLGFENGGHLGVGHLTQVFDEIEAFLRATDKGKQGDELHNQHTSDSFS